MSKDIDTVNLEEGRPFVKEAIDGMRRCVARSKKNGCRALKLIHGYGSSGKGGKIRQAARRELMEALEKGQLAGVIFGEKFDLFDPQVLALLPKYHFLAGDSDMGRMNLGITIVVFK